MYFFLAMHLFLTCMGKCVLLVYWQDTFGTRQELIGRVLKIWNRLRHRLPCRVGVSWWAPLGYYVSFNSNWLTENQGMRLINDRFRMTSQQHLKRQAQLEESKWSYFPTEQITLLNWKKNIEFLVEMKTKWNMALKSPTFFRFLWNSIWLSDNMACFS